MRFFLFLLFIPVAISQDTITFWHGYGEVHVVEALNAITEEFNRTLKKENEKFKIKPLNKGRYRDLFNLLSELPTDQLPDIIQTDSVSYITVQLDHLDVAKPKLISIHKLFGEFELSEELNKISPEIIEFYKNRRGKLDCLPFSASTVVLFYNRTLLNHYGLTPPSTWEQFEKIANCLTEHGESPLLVSTHLSSDFIEQAGAVHNRGYASHGNGMDDFVHVRLVHEKFFEYHLGKMLEWHKKNWLKVCNYTDVVKYFSTGIASFHINNANRYLMLRQATAGKFEIGVSFLPYWGFEKAVHNTTSDTTSLWVVNKKQSRQKREIIARYLAFLINEYTQAKWQRETAYIPVVKGATRINISQGLNKDSDKLKLAATWAAHGSFHQRAPRKFSRGVIIPDFYSVRDIIEDQIRLMFKGSQTPKETLDNWVTFGNEVLSKREYKKK
jgi:sn-glycerol 3-phosphate transport system substrate-binding protein